MSGGILDLIREARQPERTVELCLRGDLTASYEALQRELVDARDRDSQSFAGGDAREVAARMDGLREQMQDATVVFRMRSMSRMRPLGLLAEHPPREGNDKDRALGYNQDTYYVAMIRETCYAVERGGEELGADQLSNEDWSALFDALSHKQFDQLFSAAWMLNNDDVSVPTSALASLISQASGGSSTPPEPGESRRNGSKGGSRRGSPKSSATTKAG